jgi:hypothetical protein
MTGENKQIQAAAEQVDSVQPVQKLTPQVEDAESSKEFTGGMLDQGGCCIL